MFVLADLKTIPI